MNKSDMIIKALTKLIKQINEMKEVMNTMSESIDLLVKIETERIKED